MTLEDAKKEIEALRERLWSGYPTEDDNIRGCGVDDALTILAKVETPDPDEEGRAVLWLIVEHGIDVRYSKKRNVWVRVLYDCDGIYLEDLTPSVLAKKLGWGG